MKNNSLFKSTQSREASANNGVNGTDNFVEKLNGTNTEHGIHDKLEILGLSMDEKNLYMKYPAKPGVSLTMFFEPI
ncbi:hypothetical protein M153_2560003212 [Pseudoloma neurophilia]|uniref:Uncharacterized protein n=1 Tax=Pseudoloma neurophilia TaxID=146866 RepID=A0A0R0M4T4_9MICR|nr:hypothetical protein M153_2560003212 [Pseudoloma neurophilia]